MFLDVLNRVSDAVDVLRGACTVERSDMQKPCEDDAPKGDDALTIDAASESTKSWRSKYELFERDVCQDLLRAVKGLGGHVISNIYIPYKDGTAEIDCVVVLPSHVVVVECKCYSGVIFANYDKYKDWVQSLGGGRNFRFYSPVKQNATHIRALCVVVGITEEQCSSLIIFPDDTKLMKLPGRDAAIICHKSSISCLDVLTPCEENASFNQQRVTQILQGFAVSDSNLREQHVRYVQELHKQDKV